MTDWVGIVHRDGFNALPDAVPASCVAQCLTAFVAPDLSAARCDWLPNTKSQSSCPLSHLSHLSPKHHRLSCTPLLANVDICLAWIPSHCLDLTLGQQSAWRASRFRLHLTLGPNGRLQTKVHPPNSVRRNTNHHPLGFPVCRHVAFPVCHHVGFPSNLLSLVATLGHRPKVNLCATRSSSASTLTSLCCSEHGPAYALPPTPGMTPGMNKLYVGKPVSLCQTGLTAMQPQPKTRHSHGA